MSNILQLFFFAICYHIIVLKSQIKIHLFKVRIRKVVINMKVKAAFIFVAPEVDYKIHKTVVDTPVVHLTVIGVKNYSEAVPIAKELVNQGVKAIELCAGFGNEGIALISKAVKGKASVGAVKFDHHPGFDFKSGDDLFNN